MRKRNISVITRLNKKEQQHLKAMVKRSGLSQEAYIRHLINGVIPNDAPSPDYFSMMKELHAIGNNLNQIARTLNNRQEISPKIIEVTIEELRQMIKNLDEKVRG